jgi:predicted DNA-binding protein
MQKEEMMTNYKRLTIELPAETHTRLKVMCASKGVTLKEIAVALFDKYLQDCEDEEDRKAVSTSLSQLEEGKSQAEEWE